MQRLGYILVKQHFISDTDLEEALRIQVTQIVYRLFRWRAGKYQFAPMDHVEYDNEHFQPLSAETILMEGARMIDEWPMLERRINSPAIVFRKTDGGRGARRPGGVAARRRHRLHVPRRAGEREIDATRGPGLAGGARRPPPGGRRADGAGHRRHQRAGRIRRCTGSWYDLLNSDLVGGRQAHAASAAGVAPARRRRPRWAPALCSSS